MAQVSYAAKFAHDCTCCAFLAHVEPTKGPAFDLYTHGGDVLARTADEGPEYQSFPLGFAPHFASDLDSTLGRAFYMHKRLTERRFGRCV